MAHCKQALKRIRQSEKTRIRGKSVRNEIKTLTKNIADSVARKDADGARKLLVQAVSRIDKARKVHIYHRNAAARWKSKLARMVNAIGATAAKA
jgi:small subunit ribosomal protein S20